MAITQCEIDVAGAIFHHPGEHTRHDLYDLYPQYTHDQIDAALRVLTDAGGIETVRKNGQVVYRAHRDLPHPR